MQHPDETYIVRVRREDGDAIVEDVRSRKRAHVHELARVGELIAGWVGYAGGSAAGDAPRQTASSESAPAEPAGGALPGIPD